MSSLKGRSNWGRLIKSNATPISKKGKREKLGNYRPCLSIWETVEQILAEFMSRHMKDKTGRGDSTDSSRENCDRMI